MPQGKCRLSLQQTKLTHFSISAAQAMKLRVWTNLKNKNPNGAEIRIANINAVRNVTTSTPTATVFSIMMGAVFMKLLSTAMQPSIKGNEQQSLVSRHRTEMMDADSSNDTKINDEGYQYNHHGIGGPAQ